MNSNLKKSWLSHFTKTTLYKSLNGQQKKAINLPYYENGLVIAGAGTGKTKTLITRICALVNAKVVNCENIVALTFTNKAAKEMKERLESYLSIEQAEKISVNTFHSFALKLIQENQTLFFNLFHKEQEKNELKKESDDSEKEKTAQKKKSKVLKILDEKQQYLFIKKLFQENNWEEKNQSVEKLMTFINKAKEHGIRSHMLDAEKEKKEEMVKEDVLNLTSFAGKNVALIKNQYGIYEKKLKEKRYFDFSEIMLLFFEKLLSNKKYREELHKKYNIYLVDEFQDTNLLQYKILLLLTNNINCLFKYLNQREKKMYNASLREENEINHIEKEENVLKNDNEEGTNSHFNSIFAVGDDCQSIYQFRGAEVKNIFDFKKDLVREENYVKLEENYRSTKNIVDFSNDFISHAKEKIEKKLFTENEEGENIYCYQAFNEYQEADFVMKCIKNLLLEKGIYYKDIAVLYRSNAQSAKMETALSLQNIPFKVSGGMSFFEKEEIKTLLACAKFLVDKNDANSFIRIINKLNIVNINKSILNHWMLESEIEKKDFSQLILERKIFQYPELEKLFQFREKGIEEFKYFSLRETFDNFINNIGFIKAIKNNKKAEEKLENIHFFLEQLDIYEKIGGSSFIHFVQKIDRTLNLNFENSDNAVNLMTIHASKGLEFNYVFLIGFEDNILPSSHAIEDSNLEEELRLAYVAFTRAKKELIISFCKNRFNGYDYVSYLPSRFFCFLNNKFISPINFNYFDMIEELNLLFNQEIKEKKEEDKNLSKEEIEEIEKRNFDYFSQSFLKDIGNNINNNLEDNMVNYNGVIDYSNNIHTGHEDKEGNQYNKDKGKSNKKEKRKNEEEYIVGEMYYLNNQEQGKLLKIKRNEYEELELYFNVNNNVKCYMPEYDKIQRI